MGNSKLASRCHIPTGDQSRVASATSENGILDRVPGSLVAAALQTLPPPTAIGPATAAVIAEVGELGLIQFSVERRKVRHGRHSHYYWSATRAEHVDHSI
ncbi:MAG: hypothetical protein JO278_15955 [Dyella sp.]|nr:hypothetical protein [Dyella sp.]